MKKNNKNRKQRKPRKKKKNTGLVGRLGNKSQQSANPEAVKKDVGQFINAAIGMMYDDEQYNTIVDVLVNNSSVPIKRIAEAGVPLIKHVTAMARKQGVEVGFETLANSAPILVNEIFEIADKEGAFELDDDEKQAALSYAIQVYMSEQFAAGVYDKAEIAEEMDIALKSLTDEQREEIDKQMVSINAVTERG